MSNESVSSTAVFFSIPAFFLFSALCIVYFAHYNVHVHDDVLVYIILLVTCTASHTYLIVIGV
jgi:hypothetical protein